jgi:hypothetical protein
MTRTIHTALGWLLAAGAAIQFLLAGLAIFVASASFNTHVQSGHLFATLSILLVVVALVGRLGRRAIGLSLLAFVLYGLQCAFIEASPPEFAALHPLNGALLLVVAVAIGLGDRLSLRPAG